MARTVLVTVSDDRFGRKDGIYGATQQRISETINPTGITHLSFDWTQIQDSDFYRANKLLLDNTDPARNGRAYKPYVISQALLPVEFGDFVIYNDCSPELWKQPFEQGLGDFDISILHGLTERNGGILSVFVKWDVSDKLSNGLGIHTHDNFTTDRCLKRMQAEDHRHDFMHASGMICIQKSEHTLEFVREWLYWNCIDECAALGWKHIKDDYSFWDVEDGLKMGHRHDQSISGILLNKRAWHFVDLPMPLTDGANPYNFLEYCRPQTHYQFISSINRNPPSPDEIRKGSICKNQNGEEVRVFEIWPEEGQATYRVGKHIQSTYKTTSDKLTLVK